MVWGHMDPLENCLPEVYASHPWVYPLFRANCSWVAVWTPRDSGFLCSQQVNMPYVMIPAFPPSHQPLPVTPDSQLALPIQPIPCKPGECGRGGPATCFEIREEGPPPPPATLNPLICSVDFWALVWDLSSGRILTCF